MSKLKQQVIQMIKKLPDKVSVDDIIGELYFRLQVDKGLSELDRGEGVPHKEVVKRFSKWLKR
ncbi:MAG: hypothetical protein A3A86_06550 [Elusimicrobia bacterium RIFCSPLOWO2_01_FULL_60_11]|nr:MAG: hypothetical protein A3A86_06550 [Elusimicrobia bacterium RIFCSPLOWO2_01_FULL_60_11]